MAGVSSEASSVNIGTAKTSSHPKIKSEIQAVEAIGNSDEVCGLEKNIAVMADETNKSKPLASKSTVKGFSEAAYDSDWYLALERRDCKELMSLLQINPFLVAQTGPKGLTVLHAVAQRGCLQLLDQVLNLFKDNDQFVDKMSQVKITRKELLKAKYGTIKAKAVHMAWFTCPRQVWKALGDPYFSFEGTFQSLTQQSISDASQHLRRKLIEIMQGEPSKKAFEILEEDYQSNENYNFVLERKELQFHYVWEDSSFFLCEAAKLYLKIVIDGCQELGPTESVEVLTYLFQLHNAQGQTLLHLADFEENTNGLLKLVPEGDAYEGCLNAKDVRGWTVLHCAAATGCYQTLKTLLKDERVDVNARTELLEFEGMEYGLTALHLAILHNDINSVEVLLQCPRTDVHVLHFRGIECGYQRWRLSEGYGIRGKRCYWSPLQLAAIMGLSDIVRALLESTKFDNFADRNFQNDTIVEKNFRRISALLLASASGNPDTLRLFLDDPKYNPLVKSEEGATALHFATSAMMPKFISYKRFNIDRCLVYTDLGYLDFDTCRYEVEQRDIKLAPRLYFGRQACITMLLQAGVDIWEKDMNKRYAEPGLQAAEETLLWWHEKMAREILEAKMSLSNAANAIAVVAALVATASFVGPLQPPLGYGGDSIEGGVQDTHLSIRVFMVTNNLSFYFAIASIMFAVAPSLPMPQEGIYVDWRRTRRTVAMAMFFLLMSVLGILISFGVASNSVVSEEYSWQHDGLSFYPTLVGGFICLVAIGLFFLRLLRLVFNKNDRIRFLYETFVRF